MDTSNQFAMLQGLGFGTLAIGLLVGLAISSGLLLLSMKILNIPGRSFWKALGIVVLAGIVGFIVNILLAMVLSGGVLMMVLSIVINLLVTAGFISLFCKSPYGRSLGAAALYWVFLIILGVIFGVIMGVMVGVAAA